MYYISAGQPDLFGYNENFTFGGVFMYYVAEVFSVTGQVRFYGTCFPVRKQGI